MDKAAISAAQTSLAALGLTSKVAAADQAAFCQAWANEQVAVAITGLASEVKALDNSANNAAANSSIAQIITNIEALLVSTPAPTPPAASGLNLTGTAAADTLTGGPGADTLDGAGGGDTIITGDGADVIVVQQGQSLAQWSQSDVVTDWSSDDSVRFAHVSNGATYAEATAADYGAAAVLARNLISTGKANVVAIAVGPDVAVYADTADDNGSPDDVIILSGRTLADVRASNFGLTDAPAA